MRRFTLTTLSILLILSFSFAQRNVVIQSNKAKMTSFAFNNTNKSTVDTLFPSSVNLPCASRVDSLTILTINTSEWIFGCNSYGDKEAAQIYDIGLNTIDIDKVMCFIQKMGVTGTVYAKIYAVNPTTNTPSTLLGTSSPKLNSSIPPFPMGSQLVDVDFGQPVTVTGKFAVSIEWFYDLPNGSAMGLASSRHACTVNADKNSWIKDASDTWFSSQTYNAGGTPMLTDVFIIPVGVMTVGVADAVESKNIQVFPIPSNEVLNIHITDLESKSYELKLLNAQGAVVHSIKVGSGTNRIDISSFPSGIYFYSISQDHITFKSGKTVIID